MGLPSPVRPDGTDFVRPVKKVGIRFYGATSGYVGVKSPAAATSYDITLPDAAPAADGYVLSGNMDGTTDWIEAAGGSPGGLDTHVQFNDGGAFGGEAGFVYDKTADLLTLTRLSIGATQGAYGLHLRNTTAAAAGAQQWSPPIRLEGQGWKTNATAASQSVVNRIYTVPIERPANPVSELRFDTSVNGGAFSGAARLYQSNTWVFNIGYPTFAIALAAERITGDYASGFTGTGYLGFGTNGSQDGNYVQIGTGLGGGGDASLVIMSISPTDSIVYAVHSNSANATTNLGIRHGAKMYFGLPSAAGESGNSYITKSALSGGNFSHIYDGTEYLRFDGTNNRVLASKNWGLYTAIGDTHPSVKLGGDGIYFGAGGSTATDTSLLRTAANTLAFTATTVSATGNIVPATDATGSVGTSGTGGRRWANIGASTIIYVQNINRAANEYWEGAALIGQQGGDVGTGNAFGALVCYGGTGANPRNSIGLAALGGSTRGGRLYFGQDSNPPTGMGWTLPTVYVEFDATNLQVIPSAAFTFGSTGNPWGTLITNSYLDLRATNASLYRSGTEFLRNDGTNLRVLGTLGVGLYTSIADSNPLMQLHTTGLRSGVADGASAVAFKFRSINTLSTSGVKIASFYEDDGTTEVAYLGRCSAIGATQSDNFGLSLKNPTAAAAGAQQYSPPIIQTGYGWKTDATAASQAVAWRHFVKPIEGTSAPYGYLCFQQSVNGGAYSSAVEMFRNTGGDAGIYMGASGAQASVYRINSDYLYAGVYHYRVGTILYNSNVTEDSSGGSCHWFGHNWSDDNETKVVLEVWTRGAGCFRFHVDNTLSVSSGGNGYGTPNICMGGLAGGKALTGAVRFRSQNTSVLEEIAYFDLYRSSAWQNVLQLSYLDAAIYTPYALKAGATYGVYFDATSTSSGDTQIVKSATSGGNWSFKYDGTEVLRDDGTNWRVLAGRSWGLYTAIGDTHPVCQLQSTGLYVGPGGSTAVDIKVVRAAVQTTDATATTLWSETLADNTVHVIDVFVVARRTDAAGRWSGRRRVTVYREAAGSATLEGSVETIGTDVANGIAPTVTLDVSSNDIRLRVTGEAAKTINWRAQVDKVNSV